LVNFRPIVNFRLIDSRNPSRTILTNVASALGWDGVDGDARFDVSASARDCLAVKVAKVVEVLVTIVYTRLPCLIYSTLDFERASK
jgi:hypothetical protein